MTILNRHHNLFSAFVCISTAFYVPPSAVWTSAFFFAAGVNLGLWIAQEARAA